MHIEVTKDKKYNFKVHLKQGDKWIGVAKCANEQKVQEEIEYTMKMFGEMIVIDRRKDETNYV